MPARGSGHKKRGSASFVAAVLQGHLCAKRRFSHRQQSVNMRRDMNRVTFDLVRPAPIVLKERSFQTIGITSHRFFLMLTVHPFPQFARVVLEIFVNPMQLPAQKTLLSFLYSGEFQCQLVVKSAADPVRRGIGIDRGPFGFRRLNLDHLLEGEFQGVIALTIGKSEREPMTAPALFAGLNLATHGCHYRENPGPQKWSCSPTSLGPELRLPKLISYLVRGRLRADVR